MNLTSHLPYRGSSPDDFARDAQLVPWNDGAAKLGSIDTHEVDQGVFYIGFFEQTQNCTDLGHAFNGENSGHDRSGRKMADKKGFVDRDVFERHDATPPLDLHNPINHQERVAVRKDPHYFGDSQLQSFS